MKHTIIQDPDGEPIAVEIIASAVVEIAAAMKKLNTSRLKRPAIVTLLAYTSKLPRRTIEIVLNNLEALERDWLKPVPPPANKK